MKDNRRILVVDDEQDIVQAYRDILTPAPVAEAKRSSRGAAAGTPGTPATPEYEILHAYSGEEALALFQAELAAGRRIAGGFFDVKMEGGMDGLQLIAELWKLDPDLLCTVVTAYQDRSINDIDRIFGSRFKDQWDYLNKPFTQAEIVQKARQMTASWNRREQLARTQAQLVQSERLAAIGQVARSIGHEFGNILLVITGNADLAQSSPSLEKAQERIKLISQAADRASLIVRNLNSFAKGSQSRAVMDPGQLITSTLSLVDHETRKNNVKVVRDLPACPSVRINAAEIEQVLLNLIINAIHAMPSGGTIQIGCRADGDRVALHVSDTGTGIPPEVLPRIFDYAFTTKGDKGSGLGLAISRQIVEAHSGTIEVTSEIGKGTTFTVKLPKEDT